MIRIDDGRHRFDESVKRCPRFEHALRGTAVAALHSMKNLLLPLIIASSIVACNVAPGEDLASTDSSVKCKKKKKKKEKKKDDDDDDDDDKKDKKEKKKKNDEECKEEDGDADDGKAPAATSGVPKADPKYAGKGSPHPWCKAASYTGEKTLPFQADLPPEKTSDLRPFRYAKFGQLTIAMGPVGKSETGAVKDFARSFMPSSANPTALRHCTYFFNMSEDKTGPAQAYDVADQSAEDNTSFNWTYVSNPAKTPDVAQLEREYAAVASVLFSDKSTATFTSAAPEGKKDPFIDGRPVVPLLACAQAAGVVVMGCDSNHHRGPTVEGRFLAFAGCTPEDAYATVDTLWGSNGVPPEVRMKLIEQGVADRERFPAAAAGIVERLGGR
jgi:hypothetical protein